MKLRLYQIDAFASRVFHGNPAAVCPLDHWLPAPTMQAIAAENNLSETAFLVGGNGRYAIRWFTPLLEVDLCGHATLASAHVICQFLEPGRTEVVFDSKSGVLRAEREGDRLALDFPATPPVEAAAPPGLFEAMGRTPQTVLQARDLLLIYACEDDIRELSPDTTSLARVECFAVIASAPGRSSDFVSRFFAPRAGIPEDPVTGSAHCTLIPYWAARLAKTRLHALQLSRRGGELFCELAGDRVRIAGHAVPYLEGTIEVSEPS